MPDNYDPIKVVDAAGNVLLTVIQSAVHLEDASNASGHAGIPAWGVRNDADAVLTDADLDYTGLATDSAGRLKVIASTPAAVERKIDGDDISGAGTITIPDGVLSFALTVQTVGAGVTLSGPDFTSGAVALFAGQSIGHSADNNTLNGPLTITTTAGSVVNATWVTP